MRSERGAISVIVGVGMVMVLGMAAIAVDLGSGWAERRHVQNGADLAALAGAVELATGGGPQSAVDEIMVSINTNIGTLPTADWAPANCTDPDALDRTAASLGLTPSTNCISFAYDYSEVRVKVPQQTVDTAFAPVIGVDVLTLSASANANGHFNFGSPPPFGVLEGFQSGDEACLRTSSNINAGPKWKGNGPSTPASVDTGSIDPCNSTALDASSQYMGTLNPPLWFNDAGAVICKSNEIAYMIAGQIDHQLARFKDTPTPGASPGYSGPADSRAVEDQCGTIPAKKPNTLQLTTGVTAQVLRCGLVTLNSGGCGSMVPGPTGVSPAPARLQTGAYVQSTQLIVGESFDNEPLWNFLRSDIGSVSAPTECGNVYVNRGNSNWDYYDKRDAMVECLKRWKDNNYAPIFDKAIADGARFMFTPLLAESNLNSAASDGPTSCPSTAASKCVHIDDWIPIYVQTLYTSSNGLSANCDPNGANVGRHHAGQQFSCGASNKNIDAVSGLVLSCGMLPLTICVPPPSGNPHYPGGSPVPKIGLTK